MLDLETAIKHCEEVAEAEERSAKLHQRPDRGVKGSGKRYLSCLECAAEHRQLAEWLKELKAYIEAREEIGCLPIVWEEGAGIRKCIDILDKHLMEVGNEEN